MNDLKILKAGFLCVMESWIKRTERTKSFALPGLPQGPLDGDDPSQMRLKFATYVQIAGYRRVDSTSSSASNDDDEAMGIESQAEVHKLIAVVLFLACAGITNWAALAYIHDFAGREPLPDIVFHFVPEQTWALEIGDMVATVCSVFLIALMVLHKYRGVVTRRILFIIGVLYVMRTISLMCTQLPSGYSDNKSRCRPQLNRFSWPTFLHRLLEQMVKVGLQDPNDKMLCGDLLFSGHTLIMIISSLAVPYYLPRKLKLLGWIPRILSWLGMICMIISRTHYTIDVIFAYWCTTGVFMLYHAYCEVDSYPERRQSLLRSLWLMKVVQWLEANVVPGRFQNELEVPFSNRLARICLKQRRESRSPSDAEIGSSRHSSATTVVIEPA
uniref:PAP2_C domain-containing protein n=1 Tax=Steinernema glaseri TaxID=37863 RepID=A0A1I8A0J3_9BILA